MDRGLYSPWGHKESDMTAHSKESDMTEQACTHYVIAKETRTILWYSSHYRAPFYEIRWAQTSTERTSLAGLFHLVLIALLHYRFHQGHSLIEHLHRHPCLGLCFLGSWPQRVWEKLSVFSMSWRHHKCGCYHAKFSKARVISFFCKELENENFRLCMSHMVSATYYISPFLKTL